MDRYQTIERRALAVIIDICLFFPLIFVEIYFIDESPSAFLVGVWTVSYSLLYLSYFVVLHWKYGQTVGKKIAGVKVLDINEQPLSFRQTIFRESFYIVFEMVHVAAALYFLRAGVDAFKDGELGLFAWVTLPVSLVFGLTNVIVCFKSAKHRALHDFMGSTVVVRLDIPDGQTGKKVEPPGPDAYDGLRPSAD